MSCKLSPMEKILIVYFRGKIRKNMINMSSAEFVHRVVKIKTVLLFFLETALGFS